MKEDKILKIILIVSLLIAIFPFLYQGIPFTDDLRAHIAHVWDMKNNIENGFMPFTGPMLQLYSGWPIWQFYSLVPYWVTLPFVYMFDAVTALKASIVCSFFVAALCMLFACNLLFKNYRISAVASVAYTWFGYHFINAGSRGAFNELWGYSLFPLAFAMFVNALNNPDKKNIIYAIVATATIVLTHIPTAFMLGVMYIAYMLYYYYTCKDNVTRVSTIFKVSTFVLIGSILLTSFSLVPLYMESSKVNFAELGGTSLIGFQTPGITLTQMFERGFGALPDGTRYFYIGYVLLALSILAFAKIKESRLYVYTTIGTILVMLLPIVLYVVPLASVLQFIFRLMVIVGFCLAITAGMSAKYLSELKPDKSLWIILGIIVLIMLDFWGANAMQMTGQPNENFVNPAAEVDALKVISFDRDYFLVFAPLAQGAYMYHGHFEMGANWEGFRQSALPQIHKLYSNLNDAFINDLQIGNLNGTIELAKVMGQIGVKYFVLPCIQDLDKYYKIQYSNGQFCTYYNPYVTPLIESENSIILNEKFNINQISFSINNKNKSIVIIKISNFHWYSFIDGKETTITEIYPNYISIEVPKGEHNIKLIYKSTILQNITLLISVISLFVILYIRFNRCKKVANYNN